LKSLKAFAEFNASLIVAAKKKNTYKTNLKLTRLLTMGRGAPRNFQRGGFW